MHLWGSGNLRFAWSSTDLVVKALAACPMETFILRKTGNMHSFLKPNSRNHISLSFTLEKVAVQANWLQFLHGSKSHDAQGR